MSILKLESYCPDIRSGIWRLIIERLIQIDVRVFTKFQTEIQIELDDLDPEDWDDNSTEVNDSESSVDSSGDEFELDFDSENKSVISVVSSSKRHSSEKGLERIRELLKKEKPDVDFNCARIQNSSNLKHYS